MGLNDETYRAHKVLLGLLPDDEAAKHDIWYQAKMLNANEFIVVVNKWLSETQTCPAAVLDAAKPNNENLEMKVNHLLLATRKRKWMLQSMIKKMKTKLKRRLKTQLLMVRKERRSRLNLRIAFQMLLQEPLKGRHVTNIPQQPVSPASRPQLLSASEQRQKRLHSWLVLLL